MLIDYNTASAHLLQPYRLFDFFSGIDLDLSKFDTVVDDYSEKFCIFVTFICKKNSIMVRVPLLIFDRHESSTLERDTPNGIYIRGNEIINVGNSMFETLSRIDVFDLSNIIFANKYIFGVYWKEYLQPNNTP